jgi:hypothetical protein
LLKLLDAEIGQNSHVLRAANAIAVTHPDKRGGKELPRTTESPLSVRPAFSSLLPCLRLNLENERVRFLRHKATTLPGERNLKRLGCVGVAEDHPALCVGSSTLTRDPSLLGLLFVISPAALYSFAALLGNAVQRRNRAKLPEAKRRDLPPSPAPPVRGLSPNQQVLISFAGTIISALIGFIGTILTVVASGGSP